MLPTRTWMSWGSNTESFLHIFSSLLNRAFEDDLVKVEGHLVIISKVNQDLEPRGKLVRLRPARILNTCWGFPRGLRAVAEQTAAGPSAKGAPLPDTGG